MVSFGFLPLPVLAGGRVVCQRQWHFFYGDERENGHECERAVRCHSAEIAKEYTATAAGWRWAGPCQRDAGGGARREEGLLLT
eukprot:817465-Prymnesium_polylepis.1